MLFGRSQIFTRMAVNPFTWSYEDFMENFHAQYSEQVSIKHAAEVNCHKAFVDAIEEVFNDGEYIYTWQLLNLDKMYSYRLYIYILLYIGYIFIKQIVSFLFTYKCQKVPSTTKCQLLKYYSLLYNLYIFMQVRIFVCSWTF